MKKIFVIGLAALLTPMSFLWAKTSIQLDISNIFPSHQGCNVDIVTPANRATVKDNHKHGVLYSFDLKGTAQGIGDNEICIYMSMGGQWWRSGTSIKDVDGEEQWDRSVTCGDRGSSHECQAIVAIQEKCPPVGSKQPNIEQVAGKALCKSNIYNYTTGK